MTDVIGKTISSYQLLEVIGEDEHTLQIKAYQPVKEHYVNFTMLKPHASKDSLFIRHFLNAAEIASKMSHPNILPVIDYGNQDQVVFRVSPLTGTGTLQEHRGWFYDLQNASTLMSQITEGLAFIYARGHIHGNLKSSNVFLNPEHRPMLAGFGILQPSGYVENPFLSPEQIQGGVIDQRTDVYALGVLLYEVLTGVTPPAGMIVKPSAKRPDLPQAVEQIVLKAMAQNPDQRFQNPAEFNNALRHAVSAPAAPQPTPASGVTQSVTVQQAKGTNWAAIILGVILLAVLIGGAFMIISRLSGDDSTAAAPIDPPVTQPNEPPAGEPPSGEPGNPPSNGPNRPDFQLPEGLPDFCYSISGAAGIAVFGIIAVAKKHKRDTYLDD
jgi:serine/threonine protein kinase